MKVLAAQHIYQMNAEELAWKAKGDPEAAQKTGGRVPGMSLAPADLLTLQTDVNAGHCRFEHGLTGWGRYNATCYVEGGYLAGMTLHVLVDVDAEGTL